VFTIPNPDGYLSASDVKDVAEEVITPLPLPGVEGRSGQRNFCTSGRNFSIQLFANPRRFDRSRNVLVTNCSK